MSEAQQEKTIEETITIKKETLWKYSTFILAGILIVGGFFVFTNGGTSTGAVIAADNPAPSAPTPSQIKVSIDDDAIYGDKDAPVTLIEFSDYQCPFCRKFWQDTLPSIKKDYIDTGKVKLVFRDFPLGFHQSAIPAAEAANCAREKGGDEAYYKMHDKLFQEQNILDGGSVSSTVQFTATDMKKWAKDIGYDIDSCLDSGKYKDEIQKDLRDGTAAGITGTPGFIILDKDNKATSISGAQPSTVFDSALKAAGA